MKDKNNLEPSDYIMQGCANTLSLNEKETCVCICGQSFDYDNIDDLVKDFQDLQEYRKIEDELGINLITLFKALKDGIFIKGDESVIDIRDDRLYLSYIPEKWFIEHYDLGTFSFKDYGKTWALTKEELL